jgi:flagellar protein FliS
MNPANPRLAYRQAQVQTATPIGLVVILYDLAIEDLHTAIDALAAGDIEKRSNAIRHCFSVLEQLQGRLDFEKGGDIAQQLNRFYAMMWGRLLEAHIKCSTETLQELLGFMIEMRESWKRVQADVEGPDATQQQATEELPAKPYMAVVDFAPTSSSAWNA